MRTSASQATANRSKTPCSGQERSTRPPDTSDISTFDHFSSDEKEAEEEVIYVHYMFIYVYT